MAHKQTNTSNVGLNEGTQKQSVVHSDQQGQ